MWTSLIHGRGLLWLKKEKSEGASDTGGPSYKVNVVVEGVKTRGFLDHGAQVSLIRKELLPTIKEKQL